jgi:type I restriction enzyme S subunit
MNRKMAVEQVIGRVPEAWQYTTFGDACARGGGDIQTGPFGSQLHASDYVTDGIPSIMPQNIGDNRVIEEGIARITRADAARLARYQVKVGDIVYSRRGDVERRALIRSKEAGWLCGTGCLRVRFGKGAVNPVYASYYLSHPNVREWIVRHAHGATMPNLNTSILAGLPFVVPPKPEQLSIAHILGTLDDKIDLNRRINETLEEMARAIFKSWFVDFDPVRAKAEGREPSLPKHIAHLFPDRFEDTELSKIPHGWEIGPLEDVLTLQRGFDLPASARTPGPYLVMAASGPNGSHDQFMVRGPGVTTGRSGVLGYVFYVHDDFWPLNTSLWVKDFKRSTPAYAFHLLQRLDFAVFNAGSAVPTLNRNHVHNLQTLMPPIDLIHAFDPVAVVLLKRQRINDDESRTLAALRDTLLPKLISGELRLKDAERIIEERV